MGKSKAKQATEQHTMALPETKVENKGAASVPTGIINNWGGANMDGGSGMNMAVGMAPSFNQEQEMSKLQNQQGNPNIAPNNNQQPNVATTSSPVVSVSDIPNSVMMVTTVTTDSNGSISTKVIDPHVAPAGAAEQDINSTSSVVVGTNGVSHGQQPGRMLFGGGKLTQSTPVEGLRFDYNDGLRVHVPKGDYTLTITDLDDGLTVFNGAVNDITITTMKKYYVRFRFELYKGRELVYAHDFDAKGKNVLLRYPSGGVIGDALAWFPYAEEFRKKHQCNVYITMNPSMIEILEPGYPELHFVKITEDEDKGNLAPEGLPDDIYACYRLGVFFPCDDRDHQPVDFRVMGLHRNAALILGLNEWEEHPPKLLPSAKEVAQRTIKDPYVCIAVNGSSQAKHWNNARGWINVVKYLKEKGYRVLCIDKEDNHQVGSYMNQIPYGCEDFTGDRPLQERIDLIYNADFFIGVSSGLSWVAWGVGRPVILISGFTLPINEFTTPYRVISYHCCNGCWNDTRITFNHADGEWCPRHKNTERQFECSRNITPEKVYKVIDRCMADNGFNPKGGNQQ